MTSGPTIGRKTPSELGYFHGTMRLNKKPRYHSAFANWSYDRAYILGLKVSEDFYNTHGDIHKNWGER
jgi:hypothetical protein